MRRRERGREGGRARGGKWRRRALVGAVGAFGVTTMLGLWIALPLPADLLRKDVASIRIEDRAGRVLRSTRAKDGTDATWVSYGDIDPDLINAFVATEDRRFWDHHGIDVRA